MTSVKGLKDTIQWYDENATSYAKAVNALPFSPGLEKFSSLLPPHANVLDAGCGSGRDSRILADKGFVVTGIDISKGLLKVAKSKNPGCTFIEGDLRDLPFKNDSFDGIWAHASLVHLETMLDAKKVVDEFYRVLKKDGLVHIFVKEQLGKEKTAVVSDRLSQHERFFQYYTEEELKEMVEAVSFTTQFTQHVPDPAGREDTRWIWMIAKK